MHIGVHITAGREGTASDLEAGSSGLRAGEGGCQEAHTAPATGGALGSWARYPWDERSGLELPSRLHEPQVEKGGEKLGQVLRSSRLPRGPRSLHDAVSLTLAPS